MSDEVEEFWRSFFPSAFAQGKRFVPGLNALLQPEGFAPEDLRKWIKHHSEKQGLTPTEWARRAGLAPSTLNRFVKGNGPANIRADTIKVLAEVLVAHEVANREHREVPSRLPLPIEVLGRLEQNPVATFEWGDSDDYDIQLPVPTSYSAPPCFGIEVGSYKAEEFEDGDILVVSPAEVVFTELHEGQRFLIHKRISDKIASSHIRRLAVDPNGDRWLVRLSEDDERKAIPIDDFMGRRYDDRTFISMFVLSTVRVERWINPRR